MEFINYYKVLGLTKSASDADIKKSYRKLARKLHPDMNPEDNEANVKFQQLNEANTVLSNHENRKKYDKYCKYCERGAEYEKYQPQNQEQQSRRYTNSKKRKKIMVQFIITIPVSKVWNYWTQPRHIMNWNIASEDYYCPSAKNDLREKGPFSYTMASKNGTNSIEYKGTYIDIIPQKLLKYKIEDGRIVTIVFSEQGNETGIVKAFEAGNNHLIEEQQSGWNSILQNFKRYCEDPATIE